jgi:NhaP-type Na+/H+ or K+/H+ antiporter
MVVILFPIMKSLGQGITRKETVVLIYGGLRGALGLCLALMVGVDKDSFSIRLREIVVFNMASVATLTLLINGTTTSILVSYLQMIKKSPIKIKIN